MEGGGTTGCTDMATEATDKTRGNVFSRLGVVGTAPSGQSSDTERGIAGDQVGMGVNDDNMMSKSGVAQTMLHEGQNPEVKGETQTSGTPKNVFSRLGVRLTQGQSPKVKEVTDFEAEVQDSGATWQTAEKIGSEKVWQTGSEEGVCQEEGECMEVDSDDQNTSGEPEGGVAAEDHSLRDVEDIWEREKAAALEFEDTDSGVEFAIHLAID